MDAASTRFTDTGPYAGGDARTSSPTVPGYEIVIGFGRRGS